MKVLSRLRHRPILGALVLVVAVVALLAGCGGSAKKSSSSSSSSATTSSSTSTGTSSATTTSGAMTTTPSSGSSTSAAAAGWTQFNGDVAGTRDVQSSINSSNVSQLGVAWKVPITGKAYAFGNFSTNPVVVGGVAYAQDLASGVYAVKMSTGKVLWHTQPHSENIGPNGVNVADGKVFGATATNAFALSASTGEQLWSKKLIRNAGEGIDMAPAIHDGTVYVSTVPGNANGFYDGNGVGVLWAMDAATGKMKWKWNEVPYSLWGNKKVNSGGGQWQPPTFDAQGHLYLNVANPAPFVGSKSYPGKKVYPNGSSRPGNNLYTDSVVELNPANGKMIWHYQLIPHDILDWDLNNQAMITQANGKEIIVSAGKAGIAIANDAQTGKLLWKDKLGKRNGHDNDNMLALHHQYSKLKKTPYTQLPGNLGGVETPYATDGTTAYFAVNLLAAKIYSQAKFSIGNTATAPGEMVAIDQASGKIKWQHHLPHSPYGAATVSNDLVWTTTFDGTLWALNKNTGAAVWHTKLPAGTNSGLAVDGNTVVLGAGFPESAGQKPTLIAYRIGAKGSVSSSGSSQGASSAGGGSSSSSSAVSLKAGMKVFSSTCASCHTLAAAGSTGTVGPNLDQLKPSETVVAKQVTNGGGGMPAFGSSLSKTQITAVSQYVSKVAGTKKSNPNAGGGGAP
jgi:outer membrane protein assembly factor BamB